MTKPGLAIAALGATSLVAANALAQMAHIPENDWRQEDRHEARDRQRSKHQFYGEVRFGPYLPTSIDDDPNLGGRTPFADVFSLDCNANPVAPTGSVSRRLLVALEADYVPFRIPYVGGVGLGVGWGFTRFSNEAKFTGQSRCSKESSSLTIMPMHASLVLRVDELMRRTGVPIVPYGKFGLGLQYWHASTTSGSQICKSEGDTGWSTAACGDPKAQVANTNGLTPTLHFAVGGMLSLGFLDPRSTASLKESSGIGQVYLFGELYSDATPLVQNVLRVGNTSWAAGVAMEF